MADVKRGNRPLSPFMFGTYYRPQITSMLSILHRITGVALTLGAVLIVWWFAAAASSARHFATVDGLMTSIPGLIVLIGSLWALWFHTLNGLRHLAWDMGRGMDLGTVTTSGWAVVAGSVVMTILTLLLV